MNDLTVAILGGVGGSAATLLWESFLKPRLDARSLAELLAADVSLHAQAITAELVQVRANPKLIPVPQPVPTLLFESIIGRVGELPRALVGETLALYRIFRRLNEISERANALFLRLKDMPEGDPARTSIDADLAREVALYGRFVENAKDRINSVQPRLVKAAMPSWSPRFWFAPKPQTVHSEDMLRKAEEMRIEHETRVRRIQDLK